MVSQPKHPPKVQVWAGISSIREPKPLLSFQEYKLRLDTQTYWMLIEQNYPVKHRFQQDNDPKHMSKWSQSYFQRKHINWWRTPPSSLVLNPIENVWDSMKNYLRTTAKPKNTQELRDGIKAFWKTLTPDVCKHYVGHLRKVISKVIEVQGEPSGYQFFFFCFFFYIHCTCISTLILLSVFVKALLNLKGLAKAEVLSYIVPGMQVATD